MENHGLGRLVISPEIWPGKELKFQPGDLSQFAPHGNGVYGYQNNSYEPIKGDSPQEEVGGIVYFGNQVKKEDFKGFLNIMDISKERKDYAIFVKESTDPMEERYFKQMRLISKFGLRFMFGAIDCHEYDCFKEQELSVEEAFWEFMDSEKQRFGTGFGDPRIRGLMGGDGDYAQEELSFGFMLENDYHDVYRIWSRAWLVTK